MKNGNPLNVEVRFKLPKSAVAFIDFLCSLSGTQREGWLRAAIRQDLEAIMNSPQGEWDEAWMTERFGIAPFFWEGQKDEPAQPTK
jgi:hypothetical protein